EEKKHSCEKKECKEKQKNWQKSTKESKNKEREESAKKFQEQNKNYKKLEKEINDIVADKNISSEQAKSLKNLLTQKKQEINQARKKYDKEEK
ncbi:2604_t:CDS:2, partial [Racocetra persica]